MKKLGWMWMGLALLALASQACAASWHVVYSPSVAGRAWVVQNGISVLNCDATQGQPRCWHVNEQ